MVYTKATYEFNDHRGLRRARNLANKILKISLRNYSNQAFNKNSLIFGISFILLILIVAITTQKRKGVYFSSDPAAIFGFLMESMFVQNFQLRTAAEQNPVLISAATNDSFLPTLFQK